ncbi:hypothetical protein JQ636_12345 [Bradyrhizobium japonicum]|uniref:hypothetical protein n=1 Tax=Bradyrhizobium japonicum TaxID=375 RepID=UPI001BA8FA25|nr:hypothetical protein [Bradyrhizobium japonicum]MBR0804331.1 hypothetical protein [Bradyrhizobium japonicum]
MTDQNSLTVEAFEASPLSTLHGIYKDSVLNLRPAPEVATGEVMLASLMRNVGYVDSGSPIEGKVPVAGRDLEKRIRASNNSPPAAGQLMTGAEWERVLTGMVASPRQKRETKRRNLSISPLVPDASLYSLSARLVSNTWNPGNLVRAIVGIGSNSLEEADNTWGVLYQALSVEEDDDVLAKILENEFSFWRPSGSTGGELEWKRRRLGEDNQVGLEIARGAPAKQFCQDVVTLLPLKKRLTLRQWTSMLGSLVRLAAASHVFWVCHLNHSVWQLVRKTLVASAAVPSRAEVSNALSECPTFFKYGEKVQEPIKRAVREFITGRVALNLILCVLGEAVGERELSSKLGRLDVDQVHGLLKLVAEQREVIDGSALESRVAELLERNPKTLQCRHGVTNNVVEFLTYSISRRQTADDKDINYDQGYWIRKAASHDNAPWLFIAGPVALLTSAYCCTAASHTPKTILDLVVHAEKYGVGLRASGAFDGRLIASLRTLGLILDSPDAEGGMMIKPPFKH